GEFVPKDIPFVQIEDQNGNKEKHFSELDNKKDYPVSILIDEGSASASEILAVALKEVGYDVVGTNSFGKGTVQQAVPLGEEGMIKLTFFKWLSPEGNWINEKGVKPTVEIKQPDYYYSNLIKVDKPFKLDESDDNIETAQIILNGLGYNLDRKDDYFDKDTVSTVQEFQSEHIITEKGEIDVETASALELQIIEQIRDAKDDLQMDAVLEALYK